MRVVRTDQVDPTEYDKFINLYRKLSHPYLVTVRWTFQNDSKHFTVLDYVDGNELFFSLQKEGKFSEIRVQFYAAELVCVLNYLHSFGINHSELKPETIMLDSEGTTLH